MRGPNGFTLIELLVVLAVVGILAGVAAPSLSDNMVRRRLEGIANELQSDLQYARSQALSINSNVQLVTTASGYTIGLATAPAQYKTIVLDSKFSLSSGVTVSFEPYRGFPGAAASITVSSTGTSAQMIVKVDSKGVVQMCSPSGLMTGYVAC